MTSRRIHVGTSGWSYPDDWFGPVYPRGMKKTKMLDFYVHLFDTVELNTSFYNIPNEFVVRSWAKKVPEKFTFAAKINKQITHDAKLDPRKYGNILDVYMRAMSGLDKKIHSYLLQLPPKFAKKEHQDYLVNFFDTWGRSWDLEKLVVEFRNLSWMEDSTFQLLSDYKVPYCIVIEPLLPPMREITNPNKTYIRFHGFGEKIWFDYNFKEEEIKEWGNNINELAKKAKDVHVYFNNHFSGYAVKNALDLMDFLDVSHPSLEKLQRKYNPNRGQTTLF
ncbi:MAG: DUF72 domain-containing protein [Candidatus Hodarchaeota archaeon]